MLGLLACSQEKPAEVAASAPPAASDASVQPSTAELATAAWPEAFVPSADRLCPRTAAQPVRIYQRPNASATIFGQLAAGERVTLAARTADGWVGFDPGTAQAANVGIFRLRWVRAADAFGGADGCTLPLVTAPPIGCLLMAGRAVPVRAAASATAEVLSTIPAGSYAQVLRQVPVGAAQWAEVTVPGRQEPGYVAPDDVNLSGPCE
ncbi:hypothetical protein B0919_01855 [Hymenobacter sp. CRA2]|nr:hypothetical protein B0919_01855 [Hymenobacter sp. CRA2]